MDRNEKGDFALLIHPEIRADAQNENLAEFTELAHSAGVRVAGIIRAPLDRAHPAHLVGSGKVDEIAKMARETGADLVLVNHALSPVQERNLEAALECRVHDRTTLILDIFAQRARSHEGQLQVELAQLRHMATRLVRGWTHLERQKGGIGLRGPGETQLETDRRLLANRVRTVRRRLEKVARQRDQGRRARKRSDTPVVSLVGYTNAGKSTLFNALTGSEVLAADQLFATLDPTLRRIEALAGRPIILADTVGFIRHLPHELVAAFRGTLLETREADLLIHVVDAADPRRHENMAEVDDVLEQIGASEVPSLVVINKIDRTDHEPRIDRNEQGKVRQVWVSALDESGLDLLRAAIGEHFAGQFECRWVQVPPSAGRVRALLIEMGTVLEEQDEDAGGWRMKLELTARDRHLLNRDSDSAAVLATGLPK